MAHGVTPGVARRRARAHAGGEGRVHRLADLLRHERRRRGLRGGLPRGRRAARRRPGVGPALRLPPRPAAVGADARRRRDDHLDAQDRRLAHAVGDAARRGATGRIDADAGRAHGAARALDLAVRAADGLARRRAAPARDARRGAADGTIEASRRAREAIAAVEGAARDRRRVRRAPRRRGLGPAADRHRRPRDRLHGLRGRDRAAPPLRHPRRAGHARDDGADPRPRRARGRARALRARLRADRRAGSSARASSRRSCAARAGSRTRSSCRRARRSSATPTPSPSTTRRAACRPSRSPATRPASRRCCPGERITAELVAYLRELRDAGARLHGASDPSFETICVLRA